MPHPCLKGLLILMLFLASDVLFGLPEDRNQPIQLEADRAQLDQKTGVSLYEGNVVITQGSMRLAADRVTVYLQDGSLQRLEAIGKPVTLRYKPAIDQEEIHGESYRVEYNVNAAQVVMTQDAKITQGQDVFSGNRIEYDLKQDTVKARGTNEGERIQFTLHPRTKK
jgi:lipopolysaccharide export system protein LptA